MNIISLAAHLISRSASSAMAYRASLPEIINRLPYFNRCPRVDFKLPTFCDFFMRAPVIQCAVGGHKFALDGCLQAMLE